MMANLKATEACGEVSQANRHMGCPQGADVEKIGFLV